MKDEIKLFLETQGRKDLVVHFEDEAWNKRVAYLADIFDQLNKLNLKLQGSETHALLFQDSLRAFVSKLQNWRRKTNLGNIIMFEKLCGMMDESQLQLDQFLKDEITGHFQSLKKGVECYFPELSQEQEALVRNPFSTKLDVSSIPDEIQDEFFNLRNDSSAHYLKVKSVTQFWCAMYQSYSKVSMIALRVLVPSASTYLCEAGFSTFVNIKTKNRNILDVGDDMRLALTNFRPRISKIAAEMQDKGTWQAPAVQLLSQVQQQTILAICDLCVP
ncbi:zinc finger BED domain-containing protein 5-like [Oratosquilla oratoria]|uniref:zinc finger BED domain-containing protein 5-like n=1 Tax=Oratosquilla oratoria TaxID=337810 RepID=UPI003F7619E8